MVYECSTCGLKYRSKEELKTHNEKEHHGMPGYVDVAITKIDEYGGCPTCGFKYKTNEELEKVVKQHRGMPA
jgi:DNA-directed RNA polymerase subunit RPC12/RpoP